MSRAVRAAFAALALFAGGLAAVAGTPQPALSRDEISAVELAEWIRARRPGLLILDARSAQAMQRDRLPGAQPIADYDGEDAETVVLYGERQMHDVPVLRGIPRRVLTLRGGIDAWNAEVLFPAIRDDASQRQTREFAPRAELSRYFGGSPRVLAPGAGTHRTRSRRGC